METTFVSKARHYHLSALLLVGVLLVACSPVPYNTVKFEENPEPIRNLTIAFWLGDIKRAGGDVLDVKNYALYPSVLKTNVPAIFAENGIPVADTFVLSAPVKITADTSDEITFPFPGPVTTSHVLMINAASVVKQFQNGTPLLLTVNYQVKLWDVRKKRLEWSAVPTMLVTGDPLIASRHFAGQLLNGMHKDGLISLKEGKAIDLTGQRIF